MKLPKVNPKEELEDVSNNFFIPLFDVKKFEPRKELKDKGIDFRIELKHKNSYTGFNFLIQLKATDSIERNKDGSISWQIDTSNINYLLNSGLPAYYVLYVKKDNEFLYQNINTFLHHLYDTKPDWQNQDSHALQFKEKFTSDTTKLIYNETYKRGQFQRTLQEQIAVSSSLLSERITIDPDLNVISDNEIRRLIEKFGLYLINEGRWKEVLTIHQKGSQQVASTAKYNLVLGISSYHSGELVTALSFIKSAARLQQELPAELQEHMKLFDASIRFSLGFLSKFQYADRLKELEKSDHLRFYVRVEELKRRYLSDQGDINERFESFIEDMNLILQSNQASDSIKMMVRCELILFRGSKINMNYAQQIAQVKAAEAMFGENTQLRQMAARNMVLEKMNWVNEAHAIKDEVLSSKNYLTYFHALLYEIKVNYEFEAYTDLFELDNPGMAKMSVERIVQLDQMIVDVRDAIRYYTQISDIQNLCMALSLLYEVCHYKQDLEQATIALNQLADLVDKYDIQESRPKVESLRNDGATHQKLKAFFDGIFAKAKIENQEYDKLKREMEQWDKQELENPLSIPSCDEIHLHPIGYFEFPKEDRHKVYAILNIEKNAQHQFDYILDEIGAVPVANILNSPVLQEGYGEQVIKLNDIQSWRNIYRIRKLFFENKFRRFIPKLREG